jgi:predicted glycoside hydrolase/deacetylase ChbG (UPF0249 family)
MAERKRLIINADGYGFTPGINKGITETLAYGMVKSTSVVPNFGYLDEIADVAAQNPEMSFGVHLNLSVGKPISPPEKVPSLVGPDGRFLEKELGRRFSTRKVSAQEIRTELRAQVSEIADRGIRVSHLDGHQNKHLFPMFFPGLVAVAREFGIPAIRTHHRFLYTETGPLAGRMLAKYYAKHPARLLTHLGGRVRSLQARRAGLKMADRLITPGYADASAKWLRDFWVTLAETLPPGDSEVYCHPGYVDDVLRANAKYVEERELEVQVFTDPELLREFERNNVELISFWQLIG